MFVYLGWFLVVLSATFAVGCIDSPIEVGGRSLGGVHNIPGGDDGLLHGIALAVEHDEKRMRREARASMGWNDAHTRLTLPFKTTALLALA